MQLSKHFTLEEMTRSETAARYGLNNKPSDAVIGRLTSTAFCMEEVRELLGAPIHVTSGYRSRQVNVAVGGSRFSHHTLGYAVDFTCPRFGSPLKICRAIAASNIAFDQLIHEYGAWVHISFHPKLRREVLTVTHSGVRVGL